MKKRQLGKTDLELSVIGLGTWAIGGGNWSYGWGPQDTQDSIATILEALEGGINWIDTAAAYGFGVSEEVVGKALKEWKDDVIVATKCSRLPAPDGQNLVGCLKRESIIKECEDSLRRLGVEAIDLFQIHWPDPAEDIEEAFSALLELQKAGKIRWPGVSNFSVEQLETISKIGDCASLQPPYSLLRRDIEHDVLPWCKEHQVGVIAYSPLQCGILTGKVTPEWVSALPDEDWRKTRSPYFKEPKLSQANEVVKGLAAVAKRRGCSVAQLALAWALRLEEVTSAIVGARRKGQISETIPAGDLVLDKEEIEEIESLYQKNWS